MPSISVIIITKNESALIERCLESVKWANEIIVLDSGSTDNTVEIAKTYTPHVSVTDWPGYGVQKQRALMKATGNWVLNIDADEEVTEELKNKLLEIVNLNAPVDACRMPIRLMFYQKMLKYAWCPLNHVRFFRREGASYTDTIVHESIRLPKGSRIINIKEPLKHYCFRDLNHALYKINQYSSCTAHIRKQKEKSTSLSKAILASLWMFVRCYFIQRGFLDGKPGFLLAVLSAEGSFYRNVKQIYPEKTE